ncbi:pantothenate kinase [Salmonella enterica subsp. arizonae]|uniref:Pantothenate kinase n=1 Tax=Salmonella enterica subsp. arizonae TaxID=59203 RepID=A0A379TIK3_SALER|nr:pantothenate kinase [Salmonella enterica subsp. arizonae]
MKIYRWKKLQKIYLPLSRLLNFYISSNLRRQAVLEQFLGTNGQRIPYIISIAGSVAVGKKHDSARSASIAEPLAGTPPC